MKSTDKDMFEVSDERKKDIEKVFKEMKDLRKDFDKNHDIAKLINNFYLNIQGSPLPNTMKTIDEFRQKVGEKQQEILGSLENQVNDKLEKVGPKIYQEVLQSIHEITNPKERKAKVTEIVKDNIAKITPLIDLKDQEQSLNFNNIAESLLKNIDDRKSNVKSFMSSLRRFFDDIFGTETLLAKSESTKTKFVEKLGLEVNNAQKSFVEKLAQESSSGKSRGV